MIGKGFELMAVGMSVVFIFLLLLVLIMRLSRHALAWFNRFFKEEEDLIPTSIQRVMGKHDDIAVAIAAVKAYMKK